MVGKNNRHFNLRFKKNLTVKQKAALILGLSILLTVAVSFSSKMKDNRVTGIARPAPNEIKEVEIDAYESGKEDPVRLHLKINPKSYSKEDAVKILDETTERLEEIIKGENPSLSEVRYRLDLKRTLTEYGVSVDWMSSDFRTLGYDGEVFNTDLSENEKKSVTLLAKLRLGEEEKETTLNVTVMAPVLSAVEKEKSKLMEAINLAQGKDAGKDSFVLPEKVDGKDITYTLPKSSGTPLIFMFLGVMGAVVVVIGDKKKKEKQQKERAEELLKTSAEYGNIKSWEPILAIMYVKGTGDLGRLFREETNESFLTRKAMVKSKAQEAGTRMLFPMVLMLGVVMAIVLIPSMMSFTI